MNRETPLLYVDPPGPEVARIDPPDMENKVLTVRLLQPGWTVVIDTGRQG